MPRFTWSPEMVADACRRLEAGQHYEDVAQAHGVSRNAVTGLVYRLRFHKDPRLPESLKVPDPARTAAQRRSPVRTVQDVAGPNLDLLAKAEPIDERDLDMLRERQMADGCRQLLRAQLRAGQHLLSLPLARALASTIGLSARAVRAAAAAPRTTEGRNDHHA